MSSGASTSKTRLTAALVMKLDLLHRARRAKDGTRRPLVRLVPPPRPRARRPRRMPSWSRPITVRAWPRLDPATEG
jgi:hypothetical protein